MKKDNRQKIDLAGRLDFNEEQRRMGGDAGIVIPEGMNLRPLTPAAELERKPVKMSDGTTLINNEADTFGKKESTASEGLFDRAGKDDLEAALSRRREEENDVVERVRDACKKEFGERISEKDDPAFKRELENYIDDRLKDEGNIVSPDERPMMVQRIIDLIVGYGPLERLFAEAYTEIEVRRFDDIYVEKNGKMMPVDVRFGSEEELRTLIRQMAGRIGKTISDTEPLLDGFIREDGSRFNAVFPPAAVDGATLTIRRHKKSKVTPQQFLEWGTLDEKILDFLKKMVESKATIIASGATGSGKTTLLNLLSGFLNYDPYQSIVTIEDTIELQLDHMNVRRELTQMGDRKTHNGEVTMQALVKAALRQRPDVIVIGEIRDGAMADFLDAANSGHDGCLTTVHAKGPRALTSRVVSLFKKANIDGYLTEDIKAFYADSVELIVQIKRYPDSVRRISHISHVVGYGAQAAEILGIKNGDFRYKPDGVYVEDIFRWKRTGRDARTGKFTGEFVATGYVPEALLEKAEENGVEIDRSIFSKR